VRTHPLGRRASEINSFQLRYNGKQGRLRTYLPGSRMAGNGENAYTQRAEVMKILEQKKSHLMTVGG
jgi:hypothetical protein